MGKAEIVNSCRKLKNVLEIGKANEDAMNLLYYETKKVCASSEKRGNS